MSLVSLPRVALCTVALLGCPAARATEGDALKGESKAIEDLMVTPLTLDAAGLVPCLAWADDKGSAFYALDGNGVLRLISFPEFKVVKQKDYERKAAWLSVSAEGLVLSMADKQEVWLADPKSWEVQKKMDIPSLKRAVSAPTSSLAAASSGDRFDALYVLDLKAGKSDLFAKPADAKLLGYNGPIMTPDGKYVLTEGMLGQICRFRVEDGKIVYDDQGGRLGQGAHGAGLQLSPDCKFVCLPTGGGNIGKNYTTIIFPVADLKKPECSLESGPYPKAVGFDLAGGWIYTQNIDHPLMLFTQTGVKKKEYKIDDNKENVRQYLVHPDGNKVLILMDKRLLYVETPKKNG